MNSHAIRSHLCCIANNLGWARAALNNEPLHVDACPGRAIILRHGQAADPEIESLLGQCERACIEMRDAFNRRDLTVMFRSAQNRTACLEKLAVALKKHGYAARTTVCSNPA